MKINIKTLNITINGTVVVFPKDCSNKQAKDLIAEISQNQKEQK